MKATGRLRRRPSPAIDHRLAPPRRGPSFRKFAAAARFGLRTGMGNAQIAASGFIYPPSPTWKAQAEQDGRTAAWQGVAALRAGLSGFGHAYVLATGPKIGIRETRHVTTRAPLKEAALTDGVRADDTIALGAWPMEIHHGPGRTEYREIGGDGIYGIGLCALQVSGIANLWLGGRTLGAEPAAYASARVMGTAFATGQAAGVAAALQAGDAPQVRRELLRQGALL